VYCAALAEGTVARAAHFPTSGEGPNENDVVLLADGRTLMVVFRIDDGVDGGAVDAKNYQATTSTDAGTLLVSEGSVCARRMLQNLAPVTCCRLS
jgi:hypothetical protein